MTPHSDNVGCVSPVLSPIDSDAERLDRVFGALADPIRRQLLERLDGQTLRVSDLAAGFDVSLQAVSKHIKVLVRAGLVQQTRTGRVSRCELDGTPLYAAAVWLNRYSHYWQNQFDVLAAWVEVLEETQGEGQSNPDPEQRPERKLE